MTEKKKHKVPDNKKYKEKSSKNIAYGNMCTPFLYDMTLQKTIGNQEVQRLYKEGEILAKLVVNQPGDIYEQEADRVAQRIVAMGEKEVAHEVTHVLQQKNTKKELIQRQEMPDIEKVNILVSQGKNIIFLVIQGGDNPTYYEHPYDMDERLFIDLETLDYIQINLEDTERFLQTTDGIMDTEIMIFIDKETMRYNWTDSEQEYATEYVAEKNTERKNISQKGVEFIYSYEAPHGADLEVYNDGYGNPTIGYGHKLLPGESYPDGITIEQAVSLYRQDIRDMVNAVNNYVTVPINQQQFDALVSLTYTIGPTGFKNSTVLESLNNNQPVKSNWYAYNKATDQETRQLVYSDGLQNRRYDEYDLYSGGDYNRDY